MTDILYRLQHHQNSDRIYDPEKFLNIVSFQAPELHQFFDMLYQLTNPAGKCEKTNTISKNRIVVLCYQLASLRNKQMTLLKHDVDLFFQHSGLSKKGIDTLSNMEILTTFKTVNQTRIN
ncbi:1933_t:CDS:2 [Funneliformis mosseae]|uniref:1933_t:CDS:1 n=1 Tax=Funneliformis mosseae TaxID=27381 RepID=A0A9N9HEZ8_FUNMO|nr:1933_t:CDS:2 [Funneliformis mosseae]